MASLINTKIKDTYEGLIKTLDNLALSGTAKGITDGAGNPTNITMSTTSTNFPSGTVDFTGATVSGLPAGGGFQPVTLSGSAQSLDLSTYNFFESNLTTDVTLTFTNIPAEKEFQYSFSGYAPFNASDLIYQQSGTTGVQGQDIHFKPDGTQAYIITDGGSDEITAHNLSTPWDISTIGSAIATFDTSPQATAARGLTMSPDGTKMYITAELINTAFEYTLTTAFDITTASYSGNSKTGIISQPWGSFIKPDGTSFYVSGGGSQGTLQQYTLTTAFDLSTATLFGSFNSGFTGTQGLSISPDGSKLFTVSSSTDKVYEFDLATAFDITTAVNNGGETYIGATANAPLDIFFKSDGTELYAISSSSIYEYDSTGSPIVTLPASVQNPPTLLFSKNQVVTYTFYTLDSGSTVYLTNSSVKQILSEPGMIAGAGTSSIISAPALNTTPALAAGIKSISIGNATSSPTASSIAIGDNAIANAGSNQGAIAIGQNVKIGRDAGIAIGKNINQTTGTNDSYRDIVIGNNSYVQGGDSIAIGSNANTQGTGTTNKIAIGNGAIVSNVAGGVALGNGVTATKAQTVSVKELETVVAGGGITMKSPNGTEYKLTVSDAGVLVIA